MLFKAALVLLASWLVGTLGAYDIGQLSHLQLLGGLMLMLLGVLRARDVAVKHSDLKR